MRPDKQLPRIARELIQFTQATAHIWDDGRDGR